MAGLKTTKLSYAYGKGKAISYHDFTSEGQSPLLIIGGSGSGKTTLLHLLGGLMKPSEGSILVGNTDITSMTPSALDKFRGKHIGIIFQQNHFVEALTVIENLVLAQKLSGTKIDKTKCLGFLENLNIGKKANKYVNQLSQGERQRVAIARALVNSPSIILADEPTSALDDVNCDEVIALLEEQALANGAKLVIVTHDSRLKSRYSEQIVLDPLS